MSNEIFLVYNRVNEFREKVWEVYRLGNYIEMVRYVIEVMYFYKEVIMMLK